MTQFSTVGRLQLRGITPRRIAGLGILLFLPVAACAQTAPSPPGAQSIGAAITVDVHSKRQVIEGFGGDYAKSRFGMETPNDAVGEYTLEHLNPQHARIGIPLRDWAPAPFTAPPPLPASPLPSALPQVFQENSHVLPAFLLMQQLQKKNIPLTASIWDVPDWMAQNPGDRDQRILAPAHYDAAIEAIAAFLMRARDGYGAVVQTVSFNESNGGYQVLFTPQNYAAFIARAGKRFAELGLKTTWLAGDTSNTKSLVPFTRPILEDRAARRYLGPISFHSWDAGEPDSVFSGVAALGKEFHRPIWCLEVGYNAGLYRQRNPSPWPTWQNAMSLAKVYYKVLRFAQASIADYWQYQEDFPLVSNNGEPYQAYYIIKQLADNLPPGSRIVDAASTDSALLPLAGEGPRGRGFMLQVINTGAATDAAIAGLPRGSYAVIRTSNGVNMAPEGTLQTKDGRLAFTLPADSVSTLVKAP
jgi:O-glycosyl hydrolase